MIFRSEREGNTRVTSSSPLTLTVILRLEDIIHSETVSHHILLFI